MDIGPRYGPGVGRDREAGRRRPRLEQRVRRSGVRPICRLVPAIHFIGYNSYPLHGDPQHSTFPHLHVPWESSGYGSCPESFAVRRSG
jgi:hypothetical protein